MKKNIDCVELQRSIREQFWAESGKSIDGLKKLHDESIKNNKLLKELLANKNKQLQLV